MSEELESLPDDVLGDRLMDLMTDWHLLTSKMPYVAEAIRRLRKGPDLPEPSRASHMS